MTIKKETYIKIRELHDAGYKNFEIRNKIKVAPATISKCINTDIENMRFDLTDADKQRIVDDYKTMSADDVAKKYNISQAYVRVINCQYGKAKLKRDNSTLCWQCENVCKCSWGKWFVPVKGWTAEKTINEGRVSYIVRECPQFKE